MKKTGRPLLLISTNKEERNEIVSVVKELGLGYVEYLDFESNKGNAFIKVLRLIKLFVLVLKIKPQKVFGAPGLKSKLITFFARMPYIIYMRTVYVNSEHYPFISDKIYKFLSKRLRLRLFNAYNADFCIVTNYVTKNYLIKRGVDESNVLISGPIWLDKYKRIGNRNTGKFKRVIYITQAFYAHNLAEAQEGQKRAIKHVRDESERKRLEFYLRVHPRDKSNYNGYKKMPEDMEEFLAEVNSDDLIISTLSTLAFELIWLGANVIFVKYDEIEDLYSRSYEFLNIKAYSVYELSYEESIHSENIFGKINFDVFNVLL